MFSFLVDETINYHQIAFIYTIIVIFLERYEITFRAININNFGPSLTLTDEHNNHFTTNLFPSVILFHTVRNRLILIIY